MQPRPDPRPALGRLGERIARRHLEDAGVRVLAQNARTQRGEIDLIALEGTTLVFVEVKTRRTSRAPPEVAGALESVGPRKRARLRGAGAAWLSENTRRPAAREIRFDAIGVTIDATGRGHAVEHVRDAF